MFLRLLITEKCNRSCAGCCNKDWDLSSLPANDFEFAEYKKILITGGEPMLFPSKIEFIVKAIRKQNESAPIVLYTAKTDDIESLLQIEAMLDCLTITLHEQSDVENFARFNEALVLNPNHSYRLNVFENIDIGSLKTSGWKVKSNMKWIKNCPLPQGEVFMRLKEFKGPYTDPDQPTHYVRDGEHVTLKEVNAHGLLSYAQVAAMIDWGEGDYTDKETYIHRCCYAGNVPLAGNGTGFCYADSIDAFLAYEKRNGRKIKNDSVKELMGPNWFETHVKCEPKEQDKRQWCPRCFGRGGECKKCNGRGWILNP